MGQKVVTITECDRCGKVDEREGAEGGTPPVGWSALSCSRRRESNGWSDAVHMTLCPKCAAEVLTVARADTVNAHGQAFAENHSGSQA